MKNREKPLNPAPISLGGVNFLAFEQGIFYRSKL
jgi:hypothetical protein